MAQNRRPDDPHPALVAALSVGAVCAFFPSAVVWLAAFFVPIVHPDYAADRLQSASYWLIVGALICEYLVLRHHDRRCYCDPNDHDLEPVSEDECPKHGRRR